jgi:hypothetical protein
MTITIMLDVALLNSARQNNTRVTPRRKKSDEDRETRLRSWLDEKYDEGSWNALSDARREAGY